MSARGPLLRCVTLAALLLLAAGVLAAPLAAEHAHEHEDGVNDSDCPLAALAAIDSQAGITVAPAPAPHLVVAALAVLPLPGGPARPPASDVRLRAPPRHLAR
jgi:hypothetical protein